MKRRLIALLLFGVMAFATITDVSRIYAKDMDHVYKGERHKEGGYIKITVRKPIELDVKNPHESEMLVTAWKRSIISGYEVQFRSGSRDWKTYRISTTKNLHHRFKGLKKGNSYQVRVRAYRTIDGKRYPSQWTKKKNVHILL